MATSLSTANRSALTKSEISSILGSPERLASAAVLLRERLSFGSLPPERCDPQAWMRRTGLLWSSVYLLPKPEVLDEFWRTGPQELLQQALVAARVG